MRPSCRSLRRRSSARWRRWTDPPAGPPRRVGPSSGGGQRGLRGSCGSPAWRVCRRHNYWQKATRLFGPSVSGRAGVPLRVPRASVLQLTRRVRGPLLSNTRSAWAGSPPRGRLDRPPCRPAADRGRARPLLAPRSHCRLRPSPWDSSAAPCPGPGGAGGPAGASVNCTCHRVPSTQLVSCLPLCGSGAGARSALPPPPSVSRARAQRVPGPPPPTSPLRARVNMYISQARASGVEGAAPAHFSCADLYNYLFKGTWIIME